MVRKWSSSYCRRHGRSVVRQWVGPVRLDLSWREYRGWRLIGWAAMGAVGGQRAAVVREVFTVPKKPEVVAGESGVIPKAASGGRIFDKTPLLLGYLVDLAYEEGGGPRQVSRVSLEAAAGEWLVTLSDPTTLKMIRVRVSDPGTAWAALEALLATATCPWEPCPWLQARAGKSRR
jgi:hypothetical protein